MSSLDSIDIPQINTDALTYLTEGDTQAPCMKGVNAFIVKLFSMVSDLCNQHLISWNAIGTSFLIYNSKNFSRQVLPAYFKHSNFSSFIRQLNMYGFHKINKSPRGQRANNEFEVWEFCHSKFQRDYPELLDKIKRKAMDVELLRHENNDIYVSVASMQLSQAELLHQLQMLQESHSSLLQTVEEMKKTQLQQHMLIKNLMPQTFSNPKDTTDNSNLLNTASYQYIPLQKPENATYSIDQEQSWRFPPSPTSSIQFYSPYNSA